MFRNKLLIDIGVITQYSCYNVAYFNKVYIMNRNIV